MRLRINVIVITLLSLTFLLVSSEALAQPAAQFIRLVNSPRAAGLGSGALLLIDQESVFYNPAAMARHHLNTRLTTTSPNGTGWLPKLTNDFRLRGASVTYALKRSRSNSSAFSLGLFYQRFSYGRIRAANAGGNASGVNSPKDMTYGLSLGYARAGKLKYSFGITTRYLVSDLFGFSDFGFDAAKGVLVDAAAMFDYPISGSSAEDNQISLRASILQTVYGSNLAYIDPRQADPTPKVNQIGAALSVLRGNPNLRGVSALATFQLDSDVSGARQKYSSIRRAGIEVGLFETFYARIGTFSADSEEPFLKSYGAGFRLNGFFKLVQRNQLATEVQSGEYPFWRRVDLRIDYARIPDLNSLATLNTNFWKLSLAWIK